MFKKIAALLIAMVFVCGSVFAMCGACGAGGDNAAEKENTAAVKVNNTVCPVTGDKVDMKNPVTVEYKGKIYNLCCPMCISEFNKDPEKYSAKAK